jgi:hypothetical protein
MAGGGGCGAPAPHSHGGQLVTEHPARRKPEFGWTRVPAVYVLYSQRERPEGFANAKPASRIGWEMTAVRLDRQSPLGFKVVNGSLVAVAGKDQIALPPGEYCWHTRPGAEPIDWGATAICVAVAGGIAFAIVVAVLAHDVTSH